MPTILTGDSPLADARETVLVTSTWSAPGRVNLIGEHTDYNDGLVLPVALQQRTSVEVSLRTDGLLVARSSAVAGEVVVAIDDIEPHRPGGWAAYVAGVVWALRQAGHDVPGMTVQVRSDVPVGAGLSSSAALECSVGAALSDLLGLDYLRDDPSRTTLAAICQRAENDIALAPTGGMDQAIAMRARQGHALLLDCRDGTATQIPVQVGDHVLLVVDTRAKHALVDGQYGDRRAECASAAAALGAASLREVADEPDALPRCADLGSPRLARRARHVVTEIERVRRCAAALMAGDLTEVGRLFTASHRSLRDDFEVSCAELDLVVDTALAHGAAGARMTGGGFGGSAIALVQRERAEAVTAAVEAAFAGHGFARPAVFTAVPGEGARRDG